MSAIIGSVVLYWDFKLVIANYVSEFVGKYILTFLGIYFITSERARTGNTNAGYSDDEENKIGIVDEEYEDKVFKIQD